MRQIHLCESELVLQKCAICGRPAIKMETVTHGSTRTHIPSCGRHQRAALEHYARQPGERIGLIPPCGLTVDEALKECVTFQPPAERAKRIGPRRPVREVLEEMRERRQK